MAKKSWWSSRLRWNSCSCTSSTGEPGAVLLREIILVADALAGVGRRRTSLMGGNRGPGWTGWCRQLWGFDGLAFGVDGGEFGAISVIWTLGPGLIAEDLPEALRRLREGTLTM